MTYYLNNKHPGHPTSHALINFVNKVAGIFLDLSKAFDMVWSGTIYKLNVYKIKSCICHGQQAGMGRTYKIIAGAPEKKNEMILTS